MEQNKQSAIGKKKKNQVSPQSSLGEVGNALVRFLTPVLTVKPHSIPRDVVAETNAFLQRQKEAAANFKPAQRSTVIKGNFGNRSSATSQDQQPAQPPKPGTPGSGVISVQRDPSTPWANVVMNLMDSCEQVAENTRSRMGAQVYANRDKAAKRRKTVGHIINIMSEEVEPIQSAAPEEEKSSSKKIDKKAA